MMGPVVAARYCLSEQREQRDDGIRPEGRPWRLDWAEAAVREVFHWVVRSGTWEAAA